MKWIVVPLILLSLESHAGFFSSAGMYITFWRMVACQKLFRHDPHQFETLSNDDLFRLYERRASRAFLHNKTDKLLKVAGNQLRWNHEVYAPLTQRQLGYLERYKYLEAEHDGLRPWAPRNVGEK